MSNNNKKRRNEPEVDPRTEAILKVMRETEIEKTHVVSMIENLVGKLGEIGANAMAPAPLPSVSPAPPPRREPSKLVREMMDRVTLVAQSGDVNLLRNDQSFMEWLSRPGCKLKHYHDELDSLRYFVEFAGSNGMQDLTVLALRKSISITRLHAARETDLLAEMYWALAEVYAVQKNMTEAYDALNQCISYLEPDADENSATYKELAGQLEQLKDGVLQPV